MPATGPRPDGQPDPYHAGEREVQARAGVAAGAVRIGRSIHAEVPPPAAAFLAERRWVVAATVDAAGRPRATALWGPAGFARATSPARIELAPAAGLVDELASGAAAGDDAIGLLAIDLASRRRMRANGRIVGVGDGRIEVAVEQAYANCPKYIQLREPAPDGPVASGEPRRGGALDPDQRDRIARADTFFLATAHPTAGADASHRGGRPGFVEVTGPSRLAWPDYRGNSMFNTLGNLAIEPRAALLFVGWETGDVLEVLGRARIDWSPGRAAGIPGAERIVELRIDEVLERPGALPLRKRLVEPSPHNPGLEAPTSSPSG